jgi:MOSC domain-containing protein YiiM
MTSSPRVMAVHRSSGHDFSKQTTDSVTLLAGLGVEGDAHMGARVKHRSRVAKDPLQPNLRQVHLIASELLGEVNAKGYDVSPGDLGENITTAGLDLITLPVGTSIRIGDAVLALTGLRNPCVQIGAFAEGLQGEMLGRDDEGKLVRKTGVMAVVLRGGDIRPGDEILVAAPAGDPMPMEKI